MNSKITMAVLILAILMSVPTITAQNALPGVIEGDIFEYDYHATWNSTDPNAQPTANVAKKMQIQSFQIQIMNVTGTIIDGQITIRYKNETTKTETGYLDIQTGSIHMSFGTLIIPANLTVNEPIYPTWDQDTINETVTRTYQTGNRETNKRLVEVTSEYSCEKTEVYYDKIKGIVVDSYYESRDMYGGYTEIFTETITNTNSDVWTIPELSTLLIPLSLFVATAALLVAKAAKKRRNL
ncbi:MAG: hypothetical protein NWE95_07765 [Candidatus Bathyarchaeota archaeon]|nr:hypothetical protein [Candidatus Bathyarchaeota archaeon]